MNTKSGRIGNDRATAITTAVSKFHGHKEAQKLKTNPLFPSTRNFPVRCFNGEKTGDTSFIRVSS